MVSIHREGQQRDGTGALDGLAQLTLMLGAVAAHPAGQDLAALVGEAAQTVDVLVVDVLDLIHTEAAHLPAGATASPGTRRFIWRLTAGLRRPLKWHLRCRTIRFPLSAG